MANFVLPFIYDSSNHYILFDDMSYSSIGTSTNFFFATDPANNFYYHYDTNLAKLAKRSTADGSLSTSITPDAALKVLFVDANGKVWCIKNTPGDKIYLYDSDLGSKRTYTISDSNNINSKIDHIALTYDSIYAYIIGNDAAKIAKYQVSRLNGGNEEWSTSLSNDPIYCVVDENSNVYVGGEATSGGNIVKLDSDGNIDWSKTGTRYLAYCRETQLLFHPQYGGSVTANRIYGQQYDRDGIKTGMTNAWRFSVCFAVRNSAEVYGGSVYLGVGPSNDGVHKYITGDWSDTQAYEDIAQIADAKNYYFAGDVTGYIHTKLREYKMSTNYYDLIIERLCAILESEFKKSIKIFKMDRPDIHHNSISLTEAVSSNQTYWSTDIAIDRFHVDIILRHKWQNDENKKEYFNHDFHKIKTSIYAQRSDMDSTGWFNGLVTDSLETVVEETEEGKPKFWRRDLHFSCNIAYDHTE